MTHIFLLCLFFPAVVWTAICTLGQTDATNAIEDWSGDANELNANLWQASASGIGHLFAVALGNPATTTSNQFSVAVYSDALGAPDELLSFSESFIIDQGGQWFTVPIVNFTVTAKTNYWLSFNTQSANGFIRSANSSMIYFPWPYAAFPQKFPRPFFSAGNFIFMAFVVIDCTLPTVTLTNSTTNTTTPTVTPTITPTTTPATTPTETPTGTPTETPTETPTVVTTTAAATTASTTTTTGTTTSIPAPTVTPTETPTTPATTTTATTATAPATPEISQTSTSTDVPAPAATAPSPGNSLAPPTTAPAPPQQTICPPGLTPAIETPNCLRVDTHACGGTSIPCCAQQQVSTKGLSRTLILGAYDTFLSGDQCFSDLNPAVLHIFSVFSTDSSKLTIFPMAAKEGKTFLQSGNPFKIIPQLSTFESSCFTPNNFIQFSEGGQLFVKCRESPTGQCNYTVVFAWDCNPVDLQNQSIPNATSTNTTVDLYQPPTPTSTTPTNMNLQNASIIGGTVGLAIIATLAFLGAICKCLGSCAKCCPEYTELIQKHMDEKKNKKNNDPTNIADPNNNGGNPTTATTVPTAINIDNADDSLKVSSITSPAQTTTFSSPANLPPLPIPPSPSPLHHSRPPRAPTRQ